MSPRFRILIRFALPLVVLVVLAVLASPHSTVAQETSTATATVTPRPEPLTCTRLLPLVVDRITNLCSSTERNEACYGHDPITAEYANPSSPAAFSEAGDIAPLSAFKSLATGPLDLDTGQWGLAVLRVPATLPGTTAGQTVTFVLYGETSLNTLPIKTADTSNFVCAAETNRATYLRAQPDLNGDKLQLLPAGTSVTVMSRLAGNEWVQARYQDQVGWLSVVNNLSLSCGVGSLPEVNPNAAPVLKLPGAFYFTTAIGGQSACQDVNSAGLLITSPGGQKVNFTANGVNITIGSTVLFTANANDEMELSVLDGEADANSDTDHAVIFTGQKLGIKLGGANGLNGTGEFETDDIDDQTMSQLCAMASAANLTTECGVIKPTPTNTPSKTPVPTVFIPASTRIPPTAVPPVGVPLTNTPIPAPTSACVVQNFSANPNPAPYDARTGEACTTLKWDVEGVQQVFLNGTGVVGHGSSNVCIQQPTTFTLTLQCSDTTKFSNVTVDISTPAATAAATSSGS